MYKPRRPTPKSRVNKATQRPTGGIASTARPYKSTEDSLRPRTCAIVVTKGRIPVWAQRGLFKQPGLGRSRLKPARLV